MIRFITAILFITFFNFSFSQVIDFVNCEIKPFEVYIDTEEDYSNIRENPNGEIVLKINNKHGYGYILNVIGFENGWLKINRISGIDEYQITEFEGWIHNSLVGATTTHNLDLVDKPNSKLFVGKLIGEQDTFKIIDANCEWIKIDCNGIMGWVKSEKICGNPVTTCP